MFKVQNSQFVVKIGTNEFHDVDHSQEYLAWLAEGNTPEPADTPVVDIRAQIAQLEQENLLPRVTREFMLLSFATTAAGMGVDPATNVAYVKVKELDDRIAALRASL